ncbi:MAG: type II secretion system protein [Phycisphaeraceae bacterium]|nr:type II secretion system protein [Phycisphaeraceae bacterium]MCW5753650.1 type II secretion system protein [Phycisphaeraceae bacterium]
MRYSRLHAFTLIELLVSIAVIAILLGLAAPALRSVRESATEIRVLAGLRDAGVSFTQYAQSYQGYNPWAASFEPLYVEPPEIASGYISTNLPWQLSSHWPCLFHEIAPWVTHFRSWLTSLDDRDPQRPWVSDAGGSGVPSFHYPRSFLARPGIWGRGAPADPERLIAATRIDEVVFPANKALLFDATRAYIRRPLKPDEPRAVLAADGAASMRRDSAAHGPVQNWLLSPSPAVYHDTANGVRGRDF